jgi:hypothetical protein
LCISYVYYSFANLTIEVVWNLLTQILTTTTTTTTTTWKMTKKLNWATELFSKLWLLYAHSFVRDGLNKQREETALGLRPRINQGLNSISLIPALLFPEASNTHYIRFACKYSPCRTRSAKLLYKTVKIRHLWRKQP